MTESFRPRRRRPPRGMMRVLYGARYEEALNLEANSSLANTDQSPAQPDIATDFNGAADRIENRELAEGLYRHQTEVSKKPQW
jgi:hypothetical protein